MSETVKQSYENHLSYVSGLGNSAVREAIRNVDDLRFGFGADEEFLDSKIKQARADLESQPHLAFPICEESQLSPFLNNAIFREKNRPTDKKQSSVFRKKISEWFYYKPDPDEVQDHPSPGRIIGKLIQKDDDGNHLVDDKTFLHFLEWYNFNHVKRQHETQEQIDKNIIEFWHQLKRAEHDGWMPKSVLTSNINKLENVEYAVDDGYAFIDRVEKKNTAIAKYKPHEHAIVFGHWPEAVDFSFSHETCHAIAGHETIDGYSYDGLHGAFIGEGRGDVVINEAVTEHIAQSLQYGSVDIIDPNEKQGSYCEYRSLLDTLCNKGLEKVDIRKFIAAYFEDDSLSKDSNDKTARAELLSCLKRAFPCDIIEEIKALKTDGVEAFNQSLINLCQQTNKEN